MTDTDNSPERRRFTHIPFEASVSISSPKGKWMGKLLDVSLNVVLISQPQNWKNKENTPYLLEIHPADGVFHIRMEVTASHQQNETIGFQCNHIDIDSIYSRTQPYPSSFKEGSYLLERNSNTFVSNIQIFCQYIQRRI